MTMHLQQTLHRRPLGCDKNNRRPFSDWMGDVYRQCARRSGIALKANEAADTYWQAAYHCGMAAHEAADVFIQEDRGSWQTRF